MGRRRIDGAGRVPWPERGSCVRATDARVALAAARAMQVMGNDYEPGGGLAE